MLRVEGIEVRYRGAPVIHDVSFSVNAGELVSIVGANGSGKTTLLKTVAGTLHPTKGSVEFENENIFGPLTVEQNLRLGAYIVPDREEIERKLDYVYGLFPILRDRRRQLGETLSGGEQQMLAIGRGLMSAPKLLMLDEPSLGLMPKLVDEMLETILLVEQNVQEALDMADRGYVLQTGRTVHEGTGRALLESDIVKRAFLRL
jgi:branched-chain amino acid transport system ATP-binding protein